MPSLDRIDELLTEMLVSTRTPEEVCRDSPDLLPELRRRWEILRKVEGQIDALFPTPDSHSNVPPDGFAVDATLPRIPGYEVQSILGRGGMGVVYGARHEGLNRAVAIKMLLSGRFAGPHELARFRREAEAIAALRHPNVVQIYDIGEVEGRPFFAMEFVAGGTLAQSLSAGPASLEAATRMIVVLAEAVDAAHREGIVHRDLKPANVLIDADGTPKIADFGLARRANAEPSLTFSGARMGTPSYMAPEQASGRSGHVGPGADIYSLGAILYEMLTGRPPFGGESIEETERQLLTQEPVPPSRLNAGVPRDLETVCLKCLQKEPSRRYETAVAMLEDVRRFQRNEPILARPVSAVERAIKWARRHPASTTALGAASVFVVVAFAAAAWLVSSRAMTNRAAEEDLREAVGFQRQSEWGAADRAIDRAALRLGGGGSADLRRRLDQARRDSALAAKLIAIRLSGPDAMTLKGPSSEKAVDQYATAFLEAGLVDPGTEPEQVAQRIRESNIRGTLVIALDEWALLSTRQQRYPWLRDIIKRASPSLNGWRDRALDPQTYRDPAQRRALIADAPITRESLPLLNSVGAMLVSETAEVIPYMTRVQEAFPDDFWANEVLAAALYDAGRLAEAIAYERAALALQPNLAWVHFNLAGALVRNGDRAGAEVQYRSAAALAPDDYLPHAQLGYLYMNSDRCAEALSEWQEAIRLQPDDATCHAFAGQTSFLLSRDHDAASAYRRALELDPKHLGAQVGLRRVLLSQDRTEEAIVLWQQSMEQHPEEHEAWDGYAECCLFLGRTDDYVQARSRLLARFGDSQDAGVCERTGRACLLLPFESNDELRRATAAIDRAVAAAQKSPSPAWELPYYHFAKGLAEYRAGNHEAAVALLSGDAASVLKPAPQLVTAMARYRLGQLNEARDALAQAIASFDWAPRRADASDEREVWIYHILRREAESLIPTGR